jgi:hypothetical protein
MSSSFISPLILIIFVCGSLLVPPPVMSINNDEKSSLRTNVQQGLRFDLYTSFKGIATSIVDGGIKIGNIDSNNGNVCVVGSSSFTRLTYNQLIAKTDISPPFYRITRDDGSVLCSSSSNGQSTHFMLEWVPSTVSVSDPFCLIGIKILGNINGWTGFQYSALWAGDYTYKPVGIVGNTRCIGVNLNSDGTSTCVGNSCAFYISFDFT